MLKTIRLILLIALMLIPSSIGGSSTVFAAGESEIDAQTAITNAEILVINCYKATLDAEKAGANITQLLNVLNDAATMLSKANMAYQTSNFTSAVYYANETQTSLNGFITQADSLRETGLQQSRWSFTLNIVAPVLGSLVIVFCSFIAWSLLNKRYGSATQ